MIQSLAISPTNRRYTFCWNYTKSGQYTVKSGYWVAMNLMQIDEDVAVTRNLVRRNMRCDNYWPRCGEPEETVTHAIFQCPPALQAWELSSTPSGPQTFPVPSVYANMDYLFWRKNRIMKPEDDRDPYPWIIWYIWKAKNDKLFRGIDRDPLELVRSRGEELVPSVGTRRYFPMLGCRPPPRAAARLTSPVDHSIVVSLGSCCPRELVDNPLFITRQSSPPFISPLHQSMDLRRKRLLSKPRAHTSLDLPEI
ncbi:hypothetical protein IGI04_019399 [Brassica rapa subsp. trilocularis]|uniref:Reverse transcriptase zinc-binding domain-containing protein n=1 Tax=Brassica rapa subsp. trilocularis TaxID=1813537 RepID=A0ABQ7MI40_BRACM|nr:hypothetical protein IGI04_019399 [Brassica rapa subsp. trilocularis]